MGEKFDPYNEWLGIPSHEQPPNHYRLLSIDLFESDRKVIDAAASRLMIDLKAIATGEPDEVACSQKLLNEVAAARRCLLDVEKKAAYDAQLQAGAISRPPRTTDSADLEFLQGIGRLQSGGTPAANAAVRRPFPGKEDRRPGGKNLLFWLAIGGAALAVVVVVVLAMMFFSERDFPSLKIEGEKMKVLNRTGTIELQKLSSDSGGQNLWWSGGQRPGDELRLGFEVPRAGKYRVFGRFVRARDYGIIQLAIDGEKAGKPIDFFNNDESLTAEIPMGTFELREGRNVLSATVLGANEKALKAYMFGLDYLMLKPAR